jgi:hypothetical protein
MKYGQNALIAELRWIAFAFVLLLYADATTGDDVSRWVDSTGRIHYGNVPPGDAEGIEKLDIPDSFDEKAYEAGQQRLRETELELEQYERERDAEEERKAEQEAERKARIRQPPAYPAPYMIPPVVVEPYHRYGGPWTRKPGHAGDKHPHSPGKHPKTRPKSRPAEK